MAISFVAREIVKYFYSNAIGNNNNSLHASSSDGYQFINLFKTLSSLITPPTDTEFTLPLIDSKNGVLGITHFLNFITIIFIVGVFLKRCLQEYERLTFSQVLLLHDQWKRFYNGLHSVSLNINKVSNDVVTDRETRLYCLCDARLLIVINSKANR